MHSSYLRGAAAPGTAGWWTDLQHHASGAPTGSQLLREFISSQAFERQHEDASVEGGIHAAWGASARAEAAPRPDEDSDLSSEVDDGPHEPIEPRQDSRQAGIHPGATRLVQGDWPTPGQPITGNREQEQADISHVQTAPQTAAAMDKEAEFAATTLASLSQQPATKFVPAVPSAGSGPTRWQPSAVEVELLRSGHADHLWGLRPGLASSTARSYRGPLEPAQVLELLNLDISHNGRQALVGTHGGYLAYYHFIGPSETPAARRRPGPKAKRTEGSAEAASSKKRAGQEGWKCRLCGALLHAPRDQISNLGVHLYGTSKKPRGCIELRYSNPAEAVPPHPVAEDGTLVRLQATKGRALVPRKRKAAAE
ncbi:hypothetical protein V8E36_003986 [Tilletia maclaganii]